MKAVLNPGSGFGHEAGGVDAAVPQTSTIRKMSLEFLPVSSVEDNTCTLKESKKFQVCDWKEETKPKSVSAVCKQTSFLL